MNKNQNGFSAIEGLLILVIIMIIGFTGWFVWHARNNASHSLNSAIKEQSTITKLTFSKKPLTGSTPAPLATATTTTTPAPTPTTTKSSSSSSKSQPVASTPTPTPTPAPTPPASVPSSISISSDGCHVTGTGGAGYILDILVYQGQHGAEPNYTIPAGGTLIVSTGGMPGYTVTATISNGNTQLAQQTATVTATCPPGSPGAN